MSYSNLETVGKHAAQNKAKKDRLKRRKTEEKNALNAIMNSLNSNDICGDNCAVEIKPAPGMRLGMFATKNIPRGAIFFAEVPLVQSMNDKLSIEASCALDSYLAQRCLTPLTGLCF